MSARRGRAPRASWWRTRYCLRSSLRNSGSSMSTIGENASVMCVCVVISDWTATAFALWKIQEACSTCSTRVALQYEGIFVLSYEDRYFRTFVLQRCTKVRKYERKYCTTTRTVLSKVQRCTFVNIFYLRSKVQLQYVALYTYTYCILFSKVRKYEGTTLYFRTFVRRYFRTK